MSDERRNLPICASYPTIVLTFVIPKPSGVARTETDGMVHSASEVSNSVLRKARVITSKIKPQEQ